ncbi:MAG: hypothetical protein KJP06_08775, partial [Deltaproteobacteria bacterium]|nr:hypothetical protein [Deltaproteobacteria bacterium]
MMPISKIDFFQSAIWLAGALSTEIERNLAVAEDPYASGRWQSAAAPEVCKAYRQTLGGKPIDSFDPS